MSHSEIIRSVAKATDQQMVVVDDIVRVLYRQIQQELMDKGEVLLIGIGKLKVKETAARIWRNPRTGVAVPIPARRVVKFKASVRLEV